MKQKRLPLILTVCGILLSGCSSAAVQPASTASASAASISVKQEYEALNGQTNTSGKEHRTVTIPEDNPFVLISPRAEGDGWLNSARRPVLKELWGASDQFMPCP